MRCDAFEYEGPSIPFDGEPAIPFDSDGLKEPCTKFPVRFFKNTETDERLGFCANHAKRYEEDSWLKEEK